jgi:hypothetical protein
MAIPDIYLTRRQQGQRYQCSTRTIARWGEDPRLGYPPEIDANGRRLRRLSDLEAWERGRAAVAAANRDLLRRQRTGRPAANPNPRT